MLKEYTNDGKLCLVSLVKEYVPRTNDLRKGETQLLLCHTMPYGAPSKDTIGRLIKTVMMQAGIDTSVFKPHSTRSAATSAAKAAKVAYLYKYKQRTDYQAIKDWNDLDSAIRNALMSFKKNTFLTL